MHLLAASRGPSRCLAVAALACLLPLGAGCGSSSPVATTATPPPPSSTLATGQLEGGAGPSPGVIAGVHYTSAAASGYTDAEGRFLYQPGKNVQFSVGKIALGTVPGAAVVTPFSFNGSCGMTDSLRLLLRFLYGVDGDGIPSNGLQIPKAAASANPAAFSSLSADQLDAAVRSISGSGHGLADEATAVNSFITLVDSENWDQQSVTILGLVESLSATQGVTSDGKGWIFSYDNGMERVSDDYVLEYANPEAIPPQLLAQGSNHIGDIDYYNGVLYTSIEDGSAYLKPYIVLYNPDTLLFNGKDYLLPQDLQTEGVPWVAVDGPDGHVYTAEWNYTLQLNVFDINTMALLYSLPLSEVMDRIQGAKVFEGSLYAQQDLFMDKSMWKVNLETGTVIKLFDQRPDSTGVYGEFEGIVLRPMADGTLLHTMDISADRNHVNFRHFIRTVPPLRQLFCPQAGA